MTARTFGEVLARMRTPLAPLVFIEGPLRLPATLAPGEAVPPLYASIEVRWPNGRITPGQVRIHVPGETP